MCQGTLTDEKKKKSKIYLPPLALSRTKIFTLESIDYMLRKALEHKVKRASKTGLRLF